MPFEPPEAPAPKPGKGCRDGVGCSAMLVLVPPALLLNSVTSSLLLRGWLSISYSGVEFFHSSESRGGFRLLSVALILTLLACLVCVIAYLRRQPTTLRKDAWFLAWLFVLLWVVVSMIQFANIVFFELPRWQQIVGP